MTLYETYIQKLQKGSITSGDYGHAGRPGLQGGSLPGGTGREYEDKSDDELQEEIDKLNDRLEMLDPKNPDKRKIQKEIDKLEAEQERREPEENPKYSAEEAYELAIDSGSPKEQLDEMLADKSITKAQYDEALKMLKDRPPEKINDKDDNVDDIVKSLYEDNDSYQDAKDALDQKVKDGEISKEDARVIQIELDYKYLEDKNKEEGEDISDVLERLEGQSPDDAIKELEQMVEDGEITEEQMEDILQTLSEGAMDEEAMTQEEQLEYLQDEVAAGRMTQEEADGLEKAINLSFEDLNEKEKNDELNKLEDDSKKSIDKYIKDNPEHSEDVKDLSEKAFHMDALLMVGEKGDFYILAPAWKEPLPPKSFTDTEKAEEYLMNEAKKRGIIQESISATISLYESYLVHLQKHEPHGVGHPQFHHGFRYSASGEEQGTAKSRSDSIATKTGDKIQYKDDKYIVTTAESPPKTYEFDDSDELEDFERSQLDKITPVDAPPIVLPSLPKGPTNPPTKPEEPVKPPVKPPVQPPVKPPVEPPVKPPVQSPKPPPKKPTAPSEYESEERQAAKDTQALAKKNGLTTSVVNNKVVITDPGPPPSSKTFEDWQEADAYMKTYKPPVQESYVPYWKIHQRAQETFHSHRGITGTQGGALARPEPPDSLAVKKAQHKVPEPNTFEELQTWADHLHADVTKKDVWITVSAQNWKPPLPLRKFATVKLAKKYLDKALNERK